MTPEPKGNKGKTESTSTEQQQKKKKEHTQRLKQGQQEMRTQAQQAVRKGEIQIQIIPQTGEKQSDAKQSRPQPNTNRLYVPTRIRSAKRKNMENDNGEEKKQEGQI